MAVLRFLGDCEWLLLRGRVDNVDYTSGCKEVLRVTLDCELVRSIVSMGLWGILLINTREPQTKGDNRSIILLKFLI